MQYLPTDGHTRCTGIGFSFLPAPPKISYTQNSISTLIKSFTSFCFCIFLYRYQFQRQPTERRAVLVITMTEFNVNLFLQLLHPCRYILTERVQQLRRTSANIQAKTSVNWHVEYLLDISAISRPILKQIFLIRRFDRFLVYSSLEVDGLRVLPTRLRHLEEYT